MQVNGTFPNYIARTQRQEVLRTDNNGQKTSSEADIGQRSLARLKALQERAQTFQPQKQPETGFQPKLDSKVAIALATFANNNKIVPANVKIVDYTPPKEIDVEV